MLYKKSLAGTLLLILVLIFSGLVFADYIEPEMAPVPAGTTSEENGNLTLEYDIEMSKYIVTNGDYLLFLNDADVSSEGFFQGKQMISLEGCEYEASHIGHDGREFYLKDCQSPDGIDIDLSDYPLLYVTWYGAAAYCNWLSEKEGLEPAYDLEKWELKDDPENIEGYRVPEALEWDYAQRGGEDGQPTEYAGSDNLDEVGWYWRNSHQGTPASVRDESRNYGPQPVGQKKPNELGLYDMSGNVYEWTNTPAEEGNEEIHRDVRSGGFYDGENPASVNYTGNTHQSENSVILGFRVARTK